MRSARRRNSHARSRFRSSMLSKSGVSTRRWFPNSSPIATNSACASRRKGSSPSAAHADSPPITKGRAVVGRIAPEGLTSRPTAQLVIVDFPAPVGPISAVTHGVSGRRSRRTRTSERSCSQRSKGSVVPSAAAGTSRRRRATASRRSAGSSGPGGAWGSGGDASAITKAFPQRELPHGERTAPVQDPFMGPPPPTFKVSRGERGGCGGPGAPGTEEMHDLLSYPAALRHPTGGPEHRYQRPVSTVGRGGCLESNPLGTAPGGAPFRTPWRRWESCRWTTHYHWRTPLARSIKRGPLVARRREEGRLR